MKEKIEREQDLLLRREELRLLRQQEAEDRKWRKQGPILQSSISAKYFSDKIFIFKF
jgi:hypothetical protein